MKSHRVSSLFPMRRLSIMLAFGALMFACLCGPTGGEPSTSSGPSSGSESATEPAVQVPTEPPAAEPSEPVSTWQARQYLAFSSAWATVSSLGQWNPLGAGYATVLPGGYIRTDILGQAEVTNGGSCQVFVFQTSGLVFDEEHISSCPKGLGAGYCANDSTYMIKDCPGLKVSTVVGDFETQGTEYVVIEHRNPNDITQGHALVMAIVGTVRIRPADPALQTIELNALEGAYLATSGDSQLVTGLSALKANTPLQISDFAGPIAEMNQIDHVQRANLLLRADGLNMVPLTVPPIKLSVKWLNEQQDTPELSDAITAAVNWDAVAEKAAISDTPIFMLTQQRAIPLTRLTYKWSPMLILRPTPEPALVPTPTLDFSGLFTLIPTPTADFSGLLILQPTTITAYRPYELQNKYLMLEKAGIAQGQQKQIVLVFDSTIPGAAEMADNITQQLESDQSFVVTTQAITPDTAADVIAKFDQSGIPTLVLGGY